MRLDYSRTNGNCGSAGLRLEPAENVARCEALLRIDLQAPSRDFTNSLRNRFGNDHRLRGEVLKPRLVLRQDGNQGGPERPDVGSRGQPCACRLGRIVDAGCTRIAALPGLAKSVARNLQLIADRHDVRGLDATVYKPGLVKISQGFR